MRPFRAFYFVTGMMLGIIIAGRFLKDDTNKKAFCANPLAIEVDSNTSEALEKRVRILCWVATFYKNHGTKAKAVKETWGQRCSKLIFLSDNNDRSLPAFKLPRVKSGYRHLTAKTMTGFDYIYKQYRDKFDWFLKADDDTYMILENLRYMLAAYDPMQAIWFGSHFTTFVPGGYHSGGAGYVISRGALQKFGERRSDLCARDGGAEDVKFGMCMYRLGIQMGDSHDSGGGTRFHAFTPWHMAVYKKFSPWFYWYDVDKGRGEVSEYPISFHYVTDYQMYVVHHFVYHLWPVGVNHYLRRTTE